MKDATGHAERVSHHVASLRAGAVFRPARNYVETLRSALGNTRKYVVMPTNTHDVVILDLTEKLRRDVLDIPLDPVKGKDEKK